MRLILKLIAMPFAVAFTVTAAFLSFVLSASAIFFSIASWLVFIGAVILFITGETLGGVAFVVIAFLVSPYGLHALAGRVVDMLGNVGEELRGFIVS